MGWDGVPWLVGGGAAASAEVARVLAYAAMNGNEGIMGPDDLKVTALAVPGGSVNVAPGVCSIICRAAGQSYQAYIERMTSQDTVNIAPTDASGGRSDMVIARIEDPNLAGEPWQPPADVANGPYIFSRVLSNVPPTATTVAELGLGYSAIELARIDIPASTGTITDAMIVDLRKVANPRRQRLVLTANQGVQQDLTSSTFVAWPSAGSWQVDVPPWAVKAVIRGSVGGVNVPQVSGTQAGYAHGDLRVTLGTVATQATAYDETVPAAAVLDRKFWLVADTVDIPSSMRGTRQTLRLEADRANPDSTVAPRADTSTSMSIDIEWQEAAA